MDEQMTPAWKQYLTKPWVWILAALLLFGIIFGVATGTSKRETVAESITVEPEEPSTSAAATTAAPTTAPASAVDNTLDVRVDENGEWFAFRGNQKATDYTGLAKNAAGIWYIENGKVNFGKSGTYSDRGNTYSLENGKVISIDTNPSGSSSPNPSPNTPQSGSGTAVETATAETLDMTEELVLVHDETTGEELGYISVMHAPSSIMDDEILAYWYYNLVEPNNYLWCVIVYTDKSDSTGVFAMVNNIEKDIVLRKAADGAWYIADDTKGTFYIPTDSKDGLYKLA